MKEELNLINFIKYCLGYIKLTRQRTFALQQKYSANLTTEHLNLSDLLNNDIDKNIGVLIKLKTFYSYDPKQVTEDIQEEYEMEKELANKIEEIYNKYKNDQFTKHVVINFGYFEIEIPVEIEEDVSDIENEDTEDQKTIQKSLFDEPVTNGENTVEKSNQPQTRIDKYPLFSLNVRIEKVFEKGIGQYFVYPIDPEIQVNIGMLESILGEGLYFQLIEEIGQHEMDGKLTLPINQQDIFIKIWHDIKAQLRLKNVNFDEKSFSLEEIHLSLSPRANYFLTKNLQELSELGEDKLKGTALTSWVEESELNTESGIPNEGDLYFPFLYDKYQLRVLSLINNKASIVQGPPGTGKSETIANLLCHLAATGKKVLFVSQKTQALKVVKDKLKKLDIKYLFGYIPNPGSTQITEEDEIDGISPQLAALSTYIENISNRFPGQRNLLENLSHTETSSVSLVKAVEEKTKLQETVTSLIEIQRKCYRLHEELKRLQDFNISISAVSRFESNFSHAEWQEIRTLKSNIDALSNTIHKYENSEQKLEFDKKFIVLYFQGKKYADIIKKVKDDVTKSGYDRHSRLFRRINNARRKRRLKRERKILPREIIDYIDNVLGSDISRNQAEIILDSLYKYCQYYEYKNELQLLEGCLQDKLDTCGVSFQEFQIIDSLIKSYNLNETKHNILRSNEIKGELEKLELSIRVPDVASNLERAEKTCSEQIVSYIRNIIDRKLAEKCKDITVWRIVKKLERILGRSRRAFKTFDNLRKEPDVFKTILGLIPIWIMELEDASRIIPLEAGIFDYIILDEASQCNVAYTLPTMYRSKRALFVGDSEQMRDNTIIFKSNRLLDELAIRYKIPEEFKIKTTGAAVQSVLDIAGSRFGRPIVLRYYYRSPAELIGFSNKYFYKPKGKMLIPINSNYLTYKDTNRIMLIHKIDSHWEEEFSDKVNVAEAKAILNLFKDLKASPQYQDKSFGILTFFNAQASYIRKLFEQEGYKEDEDNYKVSIIEGIQGDEKDIVIYSFVIRSPEQRNKYVPLTGEGGDVQIEINKGRVNVAFSRARLQVHCFVSLPVQEVPEKIWIKKYLVYIDENGDVDFYSTEIKPFDSHFEEDFYNHAKATLKSGYKIRNQVVSCGFRIDFVISNTRNGREIAVECDGPTHFKDEIDEEYGIYVDSDYERGGILKTAGWDFYRIKYSDWINEKLDRNTIIQDII